MVPYEIFEHTADVGIEISGATAEEVFVSAARGMFDIIADTRQLKPKEQIEIICEAAGYEELLIEWLRELLYQYSVSAIVFKEFAIRELSHTTVKGIARGDKAQGKINTEIKAVTYHELAFKKSEAGYRARVIFDV